MAEKEKLRIDKYLWAIRIFKTRTTAAEACDRGRIKHLGKAVKASRLVHLGDEYDIRTDQRRWIIRVVALLDHRVQYSEAVSYYTDLTPAEEKERILVQAAAFYTGKRQSKIGRPTKKERRDLDDWVQNE